MEKEKKRKWELVGIFLILGVMTMVIVFSQRAQMLEERDRMRLDEIQEIRIALQQYYEKHGVFPEMIPEGIPTTQSYEYQCVTSGGACAEGKCISGGLCTDYELTFRIMYGSDKYGKGEYRADSIGVRLME